MNIELLMRISIGVLLILNVKQYHDASIAQSRYEELSERYQDLLERIVNSRFQMMEIDILNLIIGWIDEIDQKYNKLVLLLGLFKVKSFRNLRPPGP